MRESGILMHITSLPAPYGIGTMGKDAYAFVDFLVKAGQRCWQILPLTPMGYGDSPYQSLGACAGNHYLIDLDTLAEEGLLEKEEIRNIPWGSNPKRVDFGAMYAHRMAVLRLAFQRFAPDKAYETFVEQNRSWLEDYALFMALKRHFGMKPWQEWPDEAVRLHDPAALARYRELLREDVELFTYIQFLFFRQWTALKSYINSLGIGIIGDLPIYVAMDSADVWAERSMFRLDSRGIPTEVAGVPPDYFSKDGQLWGNPLYNYDAMKRDGFGWWIRRVDGAARLYDVIRIDHFRGFASYWAVPYGSPTAKTGRWVKGPGLDLLNVLTGWFHGIRFIAEDLGEPSPDVTKLLADSGLPGMRVLEFAFSPTADSAYLPHNCVENCVCYAGTHDNAPLALWRQEAEPEEIDFAVQYLGLNEREGFNRGVLRGGMTSPASLFVAQMQDWLELGEGSRINTPGTGRDNWQWRLLPGELTVKLIGDIREMTRIYGRLPAKQSKT